MFAYKISLWQGEGEEVAREDAGGGGGEARAWGGNFRPGHHPLEASPTTGGWMQSGPHAAGHSVRTTEVASMQRAGNTPVSSSGMGSMRRAGNNSSPCNASNASSVDCEEERVALNPVEAAKTFGTSLP